jgi:ketosteroid isomerase-like protein
LETVRAAFEAAERKHEPEAMLDFLDPAIVWEVRSDLPDAETYTGHDGFRRLLAAFDEVLDHWYRPVEFIEVGGQVVVPLRWGGRGKFSGAASELSETWVSTLRAGKVAHVREFASKSAALEATGLRE